MPAHSSHIQHQIKNKQAYPNAPIRHSVHNPYVDHESYDTYEIIFHNVFQLHEHVFNNESDNADSLFTPTSALYTH